MPDNGKRELGPEERARLLMGCKGLVFRLFARSKDQLHPDFQNSYSVEDFWGDVQRRALYGEFDFRVKFSTWVMRIARNHLLTYLRSSDRRPKRQPDAQSPSKDALKQAPARGDSPSRKVRHDERGAALRAAIDRLPDELNRRIVQMKFLDALSVPEIVQRLRHTGVSLTAGAVQKRLERALPQLKQELGGHPSNWLSG